MSISQDTSIEIKSKQRRFLIILGTAVTTLLLVLTVSIFLFKRTGTPETVTAEIALCDVDSSELCVVTFGANYLDRMVINFQVPDVDYPGFYVKARNRGIVNVYPCETSEETPTITHCTGMRTPLGESVDIEVYSTDGDILMARGTFLVKAILLSTPVGFAPTQETETAEPTLTETAPSDSTEDEFVPTPTFEENQQIP